MFAAHAVLAASWVAYIPLVKAKLDLSDAALGSALFGTPFGSVAAMICCRWALARWGSRRCVPVTLVGYAAAGTTIGLATSGLSLFVALAVWGAFQGALDVAMNTQAATVERLAAAPIMARFHGMWSVGGLLGAGAGAACVTVGVGLTPLLVAAAVVVLLAVAPFIRHLVADRADDTAPAEHTAPRSVWSTGVAVPAAVAFASFLTEGAAADWSANFSRNVVGTGAGTAALSYAGYSLLMVVTRLGATRLQARVAARRLLPALAVGAAIAMSATLPLATPAVTVIGFACLGAGVALLVPTAFSAAYSVGNGGPAIAVVAASGWLGYLLGPPLIGHLAEWFGLSGALVTIPVMVTVAAVAIRRSNAFDAADEFHRA